MFFSIRLRLGKLYAHTKTVVTSVHYTAAPEKLVGETSCRRTQLLQERELLLADRPEPLGFSAAVGQIGGAANPAEKVYRLLLEHAVHRLTAQQSPENFELGRQNRLWFPVWLSDRKIQVTRTVYTQGCRQLEIEYKLPA